MCGGWLGGRPNVGEERCTGCALVLALGLRLWPVEDVKLQPCSPRSHVQPLRCPAIGQTTPSVRIASPNHESKRGRSSWRVVGRVAPAEPRVEIKCVIATWSASSLAVGCW
jgi:hypothetical protein